MFDCFWRCLSWVTNCFPPPPFAASRSLALFTSSTSPPCPCQRVRPLHDLVVNLASCLPEIYRKPYQRSEALQDALLAVPFRRKWRASQGRTQSQRTFWPYIRNCQRILLLCCQQEQRSRCTLSDLFFFLTYSLISLLLCVSGAKSHFSSTSRTPKSTSPAQRWSLLVSKSPRIELYVSLDLRLCAFHFRMSK